MSSNIKFENLDGVLEAIGKCASSTELTQVLGKACALVERSAKMNAPKGIGELSRSITSKVEIKDEEVVGVVFTPLEYAPYVEFGTGLFAEEGNGRKDVPWCYKDDKGEWHTTSGQKPQPFMRPALNDNREQIMKMLKEGIGDD